MLDSKRRELEGRGARWLAIGRGALGAADASSARTRALLKPVWYRVPEMLPIGPLGAKMNVGLSWSLLSIGSGMLVGMRINTSMLIGMILGWVVAPPILLDRGWVAHMVRREMLLWIMWPAVGMLVAGGLTALVLRWKVLVKSFRGLGSAAVGGGEFPMRWVIWGSVAATIALIAVQKVSARACRSASRFIAIVLSIPLMLVGIRVLGETNWGPISALTNMMQGIFGGARARQHAHQPRRERRHRLGGVAVGRADAGLQDRAHDRQHAALPHLRAVARGAGGCGGGVAGLSAAKGHLWHRRRQSAASSRRSRSASPGSRSILAQGVSALPTGALVALIVGVLVGVVLTVLESNPKARRFVPSPTGIGIGMLVPGSAVCAMFTGGAIGELWRMANRKSYDASRYPARLRFHRRRGDHRGGDPDPGRAQSRDTPVKSRRPDVAGLTGSSPRPGHAASWRRAANAPLTRRRSTSPPRVPFFPTPPMPRPSNRRILSISLAFVRGACALHPLRPGTSQSGDGTSASRGSSGRKEDL